MRKLWVAALAAPAMAIIMVAVPVIATQNTATTAVKTQTAHRATARALASQRASTTPSTQPENAAPSQLPATPHATKKPSRTKSGEPTSPTVPTADSDKSVPAVAGPCVGVLIEPGQEPNSIVQSNPPGTTFCFAAGLHRIKDTIRPKANQILTSSQGAVLTGSVPLTGWIRSGAMWVLHRALPKANGKSGNCQDDQGDGCSLPGQLLLDDVDLTQVASQSAVEAGTFYTDYRANAIYVGTDPTGHDLELPKTQTAITSDARGVVVRGLTIEHFASAVIAGPGWTVIANEIR